MPLLSGQGEIVGLGYFARFWTLLLNSNIQGEYLKINCIIKDRYMKMNCTIESKYLKMNCTIEGEYHKWTVPLKVDITMNYLKMNYTI